VLLPGAVLQAEPAISNFSHEIRADGSRYVDIRYDLAGARDPATVWPVFSSDGGTTWDVVAGQGQLSGDYGPFSHNGPGKHIVWDAGSSWYRLDWENFRARLVVEESPDGKTVVVPLPGGRKLELVPIPAGTFRMGSPETERGRWADEGPEHTVNIEYDFYMGKFEVTQGQWESVMKTKPYKIYGIGEDYPVFKVSWNDCRQFMATLNQLDMGTFRLPSEAEWEYACRATTGTRYHYGDSLEGDDYCNDSPAGSEDGSRSDYMWYCGNNVRDGEPGFGCKPVGQKAPNAFGLHDMHGNVWEWCQDHYHPNYEGAPTDGSAWQELGGPRLLRGGAWDYRAEYCRSAARCGYSAANGYTFHGFRVVWFPHRHSSRKWFAGWPATFSADNIVSYQSKWGGWPKRMNFSEHGYLGQKYTRNWGSTIDNQTTHAQLVFLAKSYDVTGTESSKKSFLRGVNYLLEAQYENGGWPQRYPLDLVGNDYGDYITFNDDAMVGVMRLLRGIADGEPQYAFVEESLRERCATAVQKGLECILRLQVRIEGEPSIWSQQYDEKTLEPRAARAFEPVAICSRESVSVVKYLMEYDNPSPEIIEAVQSAVKWLDRNKKVTPEAAAGNGRPTWARFYEISGSRALFAGTDSKVKYTLSELSREKRTGYSYGGDYASLFLARDYPAWQKKWAPDRNVLSRP
jgi:PelA/Pel-15E family pectate lyase